ncbi:hypothetical protein [Haloferula sp. BvORR071]|uniref:hypothetical protein n=1 Tax=Haloferula sp. BvORR071 TaxID=1396141 RepID=UPI0005583615|nr:hypothetical protein [Haloferula sp. BvORR071]
MERLDPNAALAALQESFGESARFARISEIPGELRGAYYGILRFLEPVLRAAGDPLLNDAMWVDSFIVLEVSGRANQWRAEGWLICGGLANPGGRQWDVGFEVAFGRQGTVPRCRFRPPAERRLEHDSELARDFFVVGLG